MAVPTPLITISKEIMGGEPVFTGTRVPVFFLFSYLERGCSLDEFLEQFPTVNRQHAGAVLLKAANVLAPHSQYAHEPA